MKNEKRPTPGELQQYRQHYSENAFWEKIGQVALKAGAKIVYYALVLFYTLADPATPVKYRAVIAGALGYFIFPLDLIPDFIPFAGLADDWTALVAAVFYVSRAITPEIKEKARRKLNEWFPDISDDETGMPT